MDIQLYLQQLGTWFMMNGLKIILIVILTAITMKLTRVLASRLLGLFGERKTDQEFQKRTETLGAVIRHALKLIILIVAAMMILKEIGIEIGPILAAVGILGLAVGFSAQHVVQDVISGFFILMEDQIRVGDVVQIADRSGVVEKINLRMTVLRDATGNVHYVRNGQISAVTNMTKDYSCYVFDIGVAYRENIDEVIAVIEEIDKELRSDSDYQHDILEPLEVLGLDEFADSAVIIKARTKTRPGKQWRVGREFNRRMKKIFDEKNIEIPFPHMTLFMGENKLNGE